jgi:hypothetical protein
MVEVICDLCINNIVASEYAVVVTYINVQVSDGDIQVLKD